MADDGLEDWERDDLPELSVKPVVPSSAPPAAFASEDVDWDDEKAPVVSIKGSSSVPPSAAASASAGFADRRMWLVNFTALSKLRGLPEIHCKFDKNSVNDSAAVSALRKVIESDLFKVVEDKDLLQNGIVQTCSEGVWAAALQTLRADNPGIYWYPLFSPR